MNKAYTDSNELVASSERESLYVRPSPARRYSSAILFVGAGVALRYVLEPILPLDVVPFVTLFPAVALAGWYGGTGPALVAAALSWSIGTFAFVVPSYTFDLRGYEGYVAGVLFAVTGAICGVSGGNLHEARYRAEKGARRARAEEAAARESERRYRALSELVPGIVWSATRDGRVEYANAQWLAYSGRGLESGSPEGVREACHCEDAPAWDESWARATRDGESWRGEFRLRRHDGEYRWFSCRAQPMPDSQGAISRWIGLCVDIDDQKRAEENLHRIQRMETVGRLAGGIAHENNNQIAVVLGLAEFLLGSGTLTAEQRRDLIDIRDASLRIANLTRQLLALGRRQVLSPEVLSVNEVVRSTERVLGKLLGPEVTIRLDLEPGPTWAKVDPTQMSQILINLAVNARDAMPGGGTLTLSTRTAVPTHPGRLGREWPERTKVHLLSVGDTGSGMDTVLHGRIFEPFFTTKPMGRGTGLGLSVVEGIVEQSGGDLWVESAPDRGSVFTIALPAAPAPVESAPLLSSRAEPELRERELVLVVDDEERVRRTFVRALAGAGFHVYEAESGAKALALLEGMAALPKLLLTDVAMPGMSGTELARRVRELDPEICVILVSGHSSEVVSQEGALPAESIFLEKPFSPDELVRRVQQALEQSRSRPARA